MNVAYGPVELKKFLEEAARVSQVSHAFYRNLTETTFAID